MERNPFSSLENVTPTARAGVDPEFAFHLGLVMWLMAVKLGIPFEIANGASDYNYSSARLDAIAFGAIRN